MRVIHRVHRDASHRGANALRREIAREELARAEADLARVSAAHAQAAARLKDLEAIRLAQTPGISERLIEIAKRGGGGYLQLLLASDDPRAFLEALGARRTLPAPIAIEHGKLSLRELYRSLYGVEGT